MKLLPVLRHPPFPFLPPASRCLEAWPERRDGYTGVSPLAFGVLFPSEHAPIMLAYKAQVGRTCPPTPAPRRGFRFGGLFAAVWAKHLSALFVGSKTCIRMVVGVEGRAAERGGGGICFLPFFFSRENFSVLPPGLGRPLP